MNWSTGGRPSREAYPLLLTYLPDYASRSRFRRVLSAVYYDRPAITGKDLLSWDLNQVHL